MSVTVEIPMTLPSASNLREHFMARYRRVKAQRRATLLALKANGGLNPLFVEQMRGRPLAFTLTRVAPRALDDDNLRGAFKAVRDEVAAYFGVDDNDARIEWRYGQAKGKAAVRISFDVVAQAGDA